MRVLLVEDDPLLGEGVNHTLRREGMSMDDVLRNLNVDDDEQRDLPIAEPDDE